MGQNFWVVGTDTNIGKTIITTYLMRYFQLQGKSVIPYKPVQTGIVVEDLQSYYEDTTFYQMFSESSLIETHLNSYSFKEAASPHYAAKLEGAGVEEEIILNHIQQLKMMYDSVICEGAGGLYVPLNEQPHYYFIDLIKQTQLPVILVASSKLGTINHTLLSIEALKNRDIPIAGIVFNMFEDTELEINNIETIKQRTNIPVIVMPKLHKLSDLKDVQIEGIDFLERMLAIQC
ncbi:dethiobiotin synthase [Priestia taiwanensis]|uniref:ATP-dependent dethiobiotin synthetase BioD n=1 Tax=Priestia taiwanensis TaxID=1347902 RepID=A0A917EMV9_9BACI|nr:dethiobiotin synthase [Priestia taiwanensis]MBM7362324.1 dethiobiotin synthetase [Priestia taiwanensis]GGE61254.1 ATP-dependent dethiobiotin synthetase BioD [Priestia taiwanensis]